MSAYDGLPESVTEVFGEESTAERAYDLLTVDVPPASWITALTTARDALGCTYFDWLSAVDEPGTGIRVCAHVVALGGAVPRRAAPPPPPRPHDGPARGPVLPTAVEVYAGAGWHERETHEMFGVDFTGHPHLVPLLLPENFEGHPLRKDFVLAARVAKAWPGAKEPGESHDGGPKRRQMLPRASRTPTSGAPQGPAPRPHPRRTPGPPHPHDHGHHPGRPDDDAPGTSRPLGVGGLGEPGGADAPVRRARSASEGSASQDPTTAPARRTRSASEGSASQTAENRALRRAAPAPRRTAPRARRWGSRVLRYAAPARPRTAP